jgi:hypothetical protein
MIFIRAFDRTQPLPPSSLPLHYSKYQQLTTLQNSWNACTTSAGKNSHISWTTNKASSTASWLMKSTHMMQRPAKPNRNLWQMAVSWVKRGLFVHSEFLLSSLYMWVPSQTIPKLWVAVRVHILVHDSY